MNIPDLQISCLRCTHWEPLNAPSATKDASGEWRPINAKRPESWISGPVAHGEVTKGICPRCAPEWMALQETFLSTPPLVPKDIELRQPISVKPKKISSLNTFVPPAPSTMIANRDEEAPRMSSIPRTADVVPAPQNVQAATAPPAPVHQMFHNRGVKYTPNAMMAQAPAATPRATFTSARVSPVTSSPNALMGGVVASMPIAQGAVRSVEPMRVQRILPPTVAAAAQPVPFSQSASTPVHNSGVPVRNSGMVSTSAPAPVRNNGGMVSTSAPQPIARQQGCVSYSEPMPIEPKV